MEAKDIISNTLAGVALVVSIAVWRTTDTRQNELKYKVVTYSVRQADDSIVASPHGPADSSGFKTYLPKEKEDIIDTTEEYSVTITNAGKLPTKDITLTIKTKGAEGKFPPYTVELSPSMDRDVKIEGQDLVIRLNNPLGVGDEVLVKVNFSTRKNRKTLVTGFEPDEAYVRTEVGSATYIPQLKNGSMGF